MKGISVREIRMIKTKTIRKDYYQRDISERRINSIVNGFNWRAFGAIYLSIRNGEPYVVDGGHRVEAALRMGIKEVPAIIYEGLTYEEEARMFVDLNGDRGPVPAISRFKARLEYREPKAQSIKEISEKCGFKICLTTPKGYACNYQISAVGALENIYDIGGRSLLEDTLNIIAAACKGEPNSLTGMFINAVAIVLKNFGKSLDRQRLVEKLSVVSTGELRKKAAYYQALLGRRHIRFHLAQAIIDVYNLHKKKDKLGSILEVGIGNACENPDLPEAK